MTVRVHLFLDGLAIVHKTRRTRHSNYEGSKQRCLRTNGGLRRNG